jgi:hypothetical protein
MSATITKIISSFSKRVRTYKRRKRAQGNKPGFLKADARDGTVLSGVWFNIGRLSKWPNNPILTGVPLIPPRVLRWAHFGSEA